MGNDVSAPVVIIAIIAEGGGITYQSYPHGPGFSGADHARRVVLIPGIALSKSCETLFSVSQCLFRPSQVASTILSQAQRFIGRVL
jgi:hypothetical protein